MSEEPGRRRSHSGTTDGHTESEGEELTVSSATVGENSSVDNGGSRPSSQRRLRKKPFDFKLENEDTLLEDINSKQKVTESEGFQPLLHTKPTKRVQHFEETAPGSKKRKTSSSGPSPITTGLKLFGIALGVAAVAKALHYLRNVYWSS